MRLQKYLASQGLCSRSQGEALITQGRISINGKVAVIGDQVKGDEEVTFDGKIVEQKGSSTKKIVLFNKPIGVQSTLNKIVGAVTLADYNFGEERVFPIGHLDGNARGILLLTNDGELANRLSGRKKGLIQEYVLLYETEVNEEMAEKLLVELQKQEDDNILAVSVMVDNHKTLLVKTRSLRSKDIRRGAITFKARLSDICRTAVGPIRVDDIAEGGVVTLSQKDYDHLEMLSNIKP